MYVDKDGFYHQDHPGESVSCSEANAEQLRRIRERMIKKVDHVMCCARADARLVSGPGARLLADEIERLRAEVCDLSEAIDAGGFDLSLCSACGRPVVCIPDGLPMCRECAKDNS
jgi:hypothetical protein